MAGVPVAFTSGKLIEQSRFQQELESLLNNFQLYENKDNQAAALAQVPVQDLIAIAQAKYESSPKSEQDKEINAELVTRDLFLLELMNWFKTEFFSWVDSPSCPYCSQPTTSIGYGTLTPEEASRSAGRVETYTCSQCFGDGREVARFPRYNHPVVLLETREGRCGEWANCFALIAVANRFEVRYVRDWTDHVWVEVFSCGLKQNRWVHADPCENSYDNPLLYEIGWGKQLTYVIAVSQDDFQDVTWRYTQDKNLKAVLSRRLLCDEIWLVATILRLRRQKQMSLSEARKSILCSRLIQELSEFLSPRPQNDVKDSEMTVRESGSLAWRLARQELGSDVSCDVISKQQQFLWEISEDRISNSQFFLSYDSSKDRYTIRKSDNDSEYKIGWQNGVFETTNIFRKEEHDWKKVYLARKEHSNASKADISWRFKVTDPNYYIKGIELSVLASIFHPSASVVVKITDGLGTTVTILDSNCLDGVFDWNSATEIHYMFLRNSKSLTITCELQGGNGNQGWQHAQLFRQSASSSSQNAMGLSITIDLSKKKN